MRIISFILCVFIFLIIPSCRQTYHTGSVIKTVCTSNPVKYFVDTQSNIKIISSKCDDYAFKSEKVHDALDYFAIGYSEKFNIHEHEVWDLLSNLTIEASIIPREVKNVYDIKGRLKKTSPVSGLALSPDWVWVEIKTKYICESALIHEMVHIILWRTQKIHADPDHEGKEYSGWTKDHTDLIKRVNQDLCRLEI